MSHFKRIRVLEKKIRKDSVIDMKPLPKRVLDVQMTSPSYDTIRLCRTSNSPGEYACLSYCWSDCCSAMKTTSITIDEHFRGFLVSDLPTTIQDAVSAARKLGLHSSGYTHFVFHDDELDKEHEFKEMGNIYRNCSPTLVAMRMSYESSVWLSTDACLEHPGVGTETVHPSHYRPHEWSTRGLTYQEQLSPRIQYLYT